ncbi:MAG TPA: hypothetical protein VFB79_21575 [Candidatus Angelobacter sp.]|nr:hypothetical protein [Candidatus Angelobacter sp.]
MAEDKVQVPAAHAVLPEKLQKKWQKTWLDAYNASSREENLDEAGRQQFATKEANRLLRVPAPKSHEEAMDLEDWQIAHKSEKGGKLRIVTIDGKKHTFDMPTKKDPAGDKK